jgi:hypothetical protein
LSCRAAGDPLILFAGVLGGFFALLAANANHWVKDADTCAVTDAHVF